MPERRAEPAAGAWIHLAAVPWAKAQGFNYCLVVALQMATPKCVLQCKQYITHMLPQALTNNKALVQSIMAHCLYVACTLVQCPNIQQPVVLCTPTAPSGSGDGLTCASCSTCRAC